MSVVGNSKGMSRLFRQNQHPVCSPSFSNFTTISQRNHDQLAQHLLQAPCSLIGSLTSLFSTRHLWMSLLCGCNRQKPWHHLFMLTSFGLLDFFLFHYSLSLLALCLQPSGQWTFSWLIWFVVHASLHFLGHPLLNLHLCWFIINKDVYWAISRDVIWFPFFSDGK